LLLREQFYSFEENLAALSRAKRRKPNHKQPPSVFLGRSLPKVIKRPATRPIGWSEGRQTFNTGDIGLDWIVDGMLDRAGKIVEVIDISFDQVPAAIRRHEAATIYRTKKIIGCMRWSE
jgi:hypothetical protein